MDGASGRRGNMDGAGVYGTGVDRAGGGIVFAGKMIYSAKKREAIK